MEGMGMGAMNATAEHAGHDHSAHASQADMSSHDKYHGSVLRRPDGSYYYAHGAYLGHIVPGCFFIVWGTWWLVAAFEYYLRSLQPGKPAFAARSWYRWPWAPRVLHTLPLEPLIKVSLPLVGIIGELWAGHESYRNLIASNGMFEVDNLNDWQHSTMYLSFITSGAVDLLGHFTRRLPDKTEHGFLAIAFVCQLLLLLFHLKGPPIEYMVHLILGLLVAATVLAILGEAANPGSIVMAAARPYLTILQGVWWITTANIMYISDPKWDPEYMGSTMMAPVMLAVHMLWIAFAAVALLLGMQLLHERFAGHPLRLGSADGDPEDSGNGLLSPDVHHVDVEMSALMGHKHVI